MIKHIWSVLCKESKIEMDTNNISLFDAYEQLEFNLTIDKDKYDPAQPVGGPFVFEVVSLFYREKNGFEESFETSMTLLDPKSNELGKFTAKVEFKEEHHRVRNRMRFTNIALSTSGTYVFQVHTQKGDKRELVAAIPVDIKVLVNGEERTRLKK